LGLMDTHTVLTLAARFVHAAGTMEYLASPRSRQGTNKYQPLPGAEALETSFFLLHQPILSYPKITPLSARPSSSP
jgi:hypothetical protein